MSSRHDYRRRDRSHERDDRDARERYGRPRDAPRRSRSRSPPRRGVERDRRPDRRDYARDRERDRRDDRRRDDRDRRDHDRERERDGKKDPPPRDKDRDRGRERERDSERPRERDARPGEHPPERDARPESSRAAAEPDRSRPAPAPASEEPPPARPRQDSEMLVDGPEEGEEMDAANEDDADMMAMMGLSGFGSTKGKHVEGNQEGSVQIKKMRTWRQYMNRRGGFNRPLDKIK
ncbi:DUF1777-domain-containing protein [Wolfiporia cocos MD-104 SS10]|uniref:DUF1777-domain-containing protein n=1 Tax=Wolfiporia cocos (strain MD-104) TaxID=742152 RepID=A0A2H3JGX7_WOLCO|nr:DUF1777-domain-containing protein [Wolfiporia cocos MD-104 SS10]